MDQEPVAVSKKTSWERFLFILKRAPRLISIAKEFYSIVVDGVDPDSYIDDLEKTVAKMKAAETTEERRNAQSGLADLIYRL